MDFILLVLMFVILGLVLQFAWYFLPYLLIFYAIMWVIRYFQMRKIRKQLSSQASDFSAFQNAFYQKNSGRQPESVQKRKPAEGVIDAEYIEYDDNSDDPAAS